MDLAGCYGTLFYFPMQKVIFMAIAHDYWVSGQRTFSGDILET
jgi:hypothetical protein